MKALRTALLAMGLAVASMLAPAAVLTTAQLTTLKTAINAETDPTFVTARQANDETGMAFFYNSASNPAFIVWRTNVSRMEFLTNATFDWTRVDNLTVGKSRIWEEMLAMNILDCSQTNVIAGFNAAWTAQADTATLNGILALCKRTALRGEKVFATGTGSTATPGTMTVQGTITAQNISDARNLP